MRIAMFNDRRLGVVGIDDTVVDVTDLVEQYDQTGPEDLLPDLIVHFGEIEGQLKQRAAGGGGVPLAEADLHAPFVRPSKIVCLMGNYREGTDRPLQILDL